MENKKKLVRITTVPISLEKLLTGQLEFMSDHYQVIMVSSEKEALENQGKKRNLATFHVDLTRQITPFKDLKALLKLYVFFRKTRPFIVHTHTPKAGTIGMLAAKLAGVPNRLHTVAGLPLLETSGKKRKLLDLVERITYSCANKVFPNSSGLKDIIITLNYCKPEKLSVIANGSSNGIDTSYFNPDFFSLEQKDALKKQLEILPSDFVFIFVGRLVKDKGINELIKAFQRINNTQINTKLLLVGDYEAELDPLAEETISAIRENKNILTVGFQFDVRPYFAIADTLIFPTYREGFPNVVMQAGAMNLPSIVTDINGCNEIIKEGLNGLIIPVKDENAIFDAMKLMLRETAVYQKMKSNARTMILSRYEQKVVWQALLDEYKSLENNV